jgi:tRNA1(Val) A37 N6-methylase TrmN6
MSEENAAALSEDTLLGGRVRLRQPVKGERVSIDAVLLAAAVPAVAGDSVLDVGCGSGAASLCLAARVPGARVTGIDRERDAVRLAGDNILLNGWGARVAAMAGDLLQPPPRLEPGTFAHAMANPPFLDAARATSPPDPGKAKARVEGEADLAAFVRFALAMVRQKGTITLIHRADRIEQVLAQLAGRVGEIVIFPLWPGGGRPARRIIIRARKAAATPTRLVPGLVLHEADGRFTAAAEAVLRDAAALPLDEGETAPHLSPR